VVVERILESRRLRDFAADERRHRETAFALDAFLIPNKLAAGGVAGLATVIYYGAKAQFGVTLPVGLQMLVMKRRAAPCGVALPGLALCCKTLYGAVALSILVDADRPVHPALGGSDLLLAALWGGAVSGLGMGLVFKGGGNTGGTDIVAQLLSSRFPLGCGQS